MSAHPTARDEHWFWDTPEWHAYCLAYGGGWHHNFGAHGNLVVGLSTEMWSHVRHGHQAAVRAARDLRIEPGAFEDYSFMHLASFGKVRSAATYAAQKAIMEAGMADVWLARDALHVRSCALFYRYRDGAYYASAPRCRKHDEVSGAHALVWTAMLNYLALGLRWLDLGPVPGADASEKEQSIAHFKKGFGVLVKMWPW